MPRTTFEPELLLSFGGMMAIYRVRAPDAEARARAVLAGEPHEPAAEEPLDLERLTRDQIAAAVIQGFKGHGLERLVEALLQSQG